MRSRNLLGKHRVIQTNFSPIPTLRERMHYTLRSTSATSMTWNGSTRVSTHGKDQLNSQSLPMQSNNHRFHTQRRRFAQAKTAQVIEELSPQLKMDIHAKVGMLGLQNTPTADSSQTITVEILMAQKPFGVS